MNVGNRVRTALRAVRIRQTSRAWTAASHGLSATRLLSTTSMREPPPHSSKPGTQPGPSRATQKMSTPPPPDERKDIREKRKPRNSEIKFAVVRLVNPETGVLDPPSRLRDVLARVNLRTQFVELMTEQPEPIVKIHDKKLLYDREKTKKLLQVNKKPPEEKEVQLTWGVGTGDLQFKLKKVRAELEDGNRVNLVFAPKKGQVLPTPAEQENIVQEALDLLADVGKERKARTVQKQAVAVFLETMRPKKTVELKWTYGNSDSWEGLKAVEPALRNGERVELVFLLPPPPRKERQRTSKEEDPNAAQTVDPAIARERVERTLKNLASVGREWKARDVRKAIIVAHLEGVSSS
ncbi:hypothetical protein C8Q78DRAFT_40705 [Trametes maxima]|nr:hypothetical protein C8Q78DRAFT_40705 [Trametes maxima]